MIEVLITIILNLGYNVEYGTHFRMNESVAQKVINTNEFKSNFKIEEFNKIVTIDESLDDIIITDDDNPIENR